MLSSRSLAPADPTNLETQLLSLRPGDKIVLFTFDEAPKLSKVAKLLINELGSVHIQNVQFRTSWYLLSEKQVTVGYRTQTLELKSILYEVIE